MKKAKSLVIPLVILLLYSLSITYAFQYFFTTEKILVNSSLLITKMSDLGSRVGSTNEFFVFDNLVTSTDLSLFLQCFKGTAPTEYMYLADLGSRVNGQNEFFAYDGRVDSTDLQLFLLCYKGHGP